MNSYDDSYRGSDCIIPPRSIVNGTAPMGVFIAYLNSVDVNKIRLCDIIPIYHWLSQFIASLPEEVRKQCEQAMLKETEA